MSKRRIAAIVVLVLLALVAVVNWTWGDLPGQPRDTGSHAQLGGVGVRWIERGPSGSAGPAAPAVLLLHGLPGTAEDFARVTPLLPRMRTIALDRPGYGFSDGGHHSLDIQLETIVRLLDRLAIDRAIVVGHSYGGTVALAFAARHPDRVQGLVLVDAAAAGHRSKGADRAQARLVQFLSLPVVQPLADLGFSGAMRRLSAEMGAAKAFDPDPVDPAYERRVLSETMRHEDLDAYAGERLAFDEEAARLDRRLAGIATPAVVIQGDGDRLVSPAVGRRLAGELPRARFVGVPGGHMVPLVHPGAVAAAVRTCAAQCGTH